MFQQFIDANFSSNLSFAAHNFTGIDITTEEGASLDELFVDPVENPTSPDQVEVHENLETPDFVLDDDNTNAIEMETEATGSTSILVATVFQDDDDERTTKKSSKRKSVRFIGKYWQNNLL